MQKELEKHSIVLLGVGHTNAHILKMWRMQPISGARLTCVSNFPLVTYSGMLPGVLAGLYQPEQMEIDLVRLCSVSAARLILDPVTGIDRQQRKLLFANRSPLPFDLLSIGIGSVPTTENVEFSENAPLVLIKPMQTFLQRLEEQLDRLERLSANRGVEIAVVGGGVGGIEITFCLSQRLKKFQPKIKFRIRLISGSETLVGGSLDATEKVVRRELEKAGVDVVSGNRVQAVNDDHVLLTTGKKFEADLVLWATSAKAAPTMDHWDLEKDERGFLATRTTLQTTQDDRIFVVGDSGTMIEDPTAKAGVYAVRQGPILWENLKRSLVHQPLQSYRPQRSFLKLINLGDGRAIAEYLRRAFTGKWCWHWKNHIDVKFMRMYQDYQPMEMKSEAKPDATPQMRCVGCGGKISGASLESALAEIQFENNEQVVVGVDHPDDAAIVRTPGNEVTVTTDFFASPIDDPFLFGRISALNGSSDCFAMGAQPFAALAMAQVPFGHAKAQREFLVEMMAGSAREFNQIKTAIVGGHSIEGPRMALGFTVMANQVTDPLFKSNLQNGDQLILTKALGTGALLAALMDGKCRGRWFEAMIDSMLLNNSIALDVANRFSICAMTDVTGFGLAGHLFELLVASKKNAVLRLNQIATLDGFDELTQQGIESTMTIENQSVETSIQVSESLSRNATYKSLFDPQTCGGLLIAAIADEADPLCQFLQDQGFGASAIVGTVEEPKNGSLSILIE